MIGPNLKAAVGSSKNEFQLSPDLFTCANMIKKLAGTISRLLFTLGVLCSVSSAAWAQDADKLGIADKSTYLSDISNLCHVNWPKNRIVTIVCHGHSVPAGYFQTPEIHSLEAYPNLLRIGLAGKYPHAVINVIVTAIGGENSEQGAKRFDADVLALHPDVVTIDYAINDRRIGLQRARQAWVSMIEKALATHVKVILLTPTPVLSLNFDNAGDPLNQHAEQIRHLAAEYHLGLVDSLAAFQKVVQSGTPLPDLMSLSVHPNAKGHQLVGEALLEWFP